MKQLYFLLFVFCITVANAQIINFPDANFKARLLSAQGGDGIAYGLDGVSFNIDANNDNEIDQNEALQVSHLVLYNCGISNLEGLQYFTNLRQLNCAGNTIANLDLSPFTQLIGFDAYSNNIEQLTVSGLSHLTNFSCGNNTISELVVSDLPMLHSIHCNNNLLQEIDLSDLPNLYQLKCHNNQITTLNLNDKNRLRILNCSNNSLTTLFVKNTNLINPEFDFSGNNALQYVCADERILPIVTNKISEYGYINCFANSYCSYIPGQDYYTITGNVKYDEDNNGCTANDAVYPNISLSVSDGTNAGSVLANESGNYALTVQEGTHVITPIFVNPAYFNATPAATAVVVSNQATVYLQDICITPNGLHPDLNISINLTNSGFARPGEDNLYTILFKNEGTNTQSGTINFMYNGSILSYVSSSAVSASQSLNMVALTFADLRPFETQEIEIVLHLNSFTDFPSVNEGDMLSFTSQLITPATDETPLNNTFTLIQEVSTVELDTDNFTFSNYFTLYPNPATTIINIVPKGSVQTQSVSIYNFIGQLVISVPAGNSSLDVSNLQSGNYIVKVATDKGILTSRFIKK